MSNGELQTVVNFRKPDSHDVRAAPFQLTLSSTPFVIDFRALPGSDLAGTPFRPSGVYIDNTQGTDKLTVLVNELNYRMVCKAGELINLPYPAAKYSSVGITGEGQATVIFVDYPVEPYESSLTEIAPVVTEWGTITGDIFAQGDLQAEFDLKPDGTNDGGIQFNTTDVAVAPSIYSPVANTLVTSPPSNSEAISFSLFGQNIHVGPGNIINGGHIVGCIGWSINNSNTTMAMGIGVEGRFDNAGGGVTTRGQGLLGLVTAQSGTITGAYGSRSEFQSFPGASITRCVGYDSNVGINAGTISAYVGFSQPRITGVVPAPANMRSFENLEPHAPISSAAPICSAAWELVAVSTGFSYTIPDHIDDIQLHAGAAVAMGTVTFPNPANVTDGMLLYIGSTNGVTALTLNGNGATILNPATALSSGAVVIYKFYGRGTNVWVRR